MKKSMIIDHPLWEKEKPSKEFKKWYKERTGLEAIDKMIPNEKYWKLMDKLLTP